MAHVVPDERQLLPEDAQQAGAKEALLRHDREVDRRGEEDDQDGNLAHVVPAAGLEHVALQELLAQGTVLLDKVGDLVVRDLPDVVPRQQLFVHARRVVVGEGIGHVLARQVGDGQPAAGVRVHVRSDVVAVPVHHDPGVVALVVLGHLGHRQVAARAAAVLRRVERLHAERLAFVLAPHAAAAAAHHRRGGRGSGRGRGRISASGLAHAGHRSLFLRGHGVGGGW